MFIAKLYQTRPHPALQFGYIVNAHYQSETIRNHARSLIRDYYLPMNDPLLSLSQLLSDAILPSLKAVQACQAEQIAAHNRIETTIQELRLHIKSQLALISFQLSACRAELAAAHAALKAAQVQSGTRALDRTTLIH